jgi:hypothetical protein
MLGIRDTKKNAARYSQLSNIQLIVKSKGLATGTDNSYGTVDGSNVITAIKSITPGPTGKDFSVNGSGVTFDPTNKSIVFNGSGRLRSTGAASVYDFLSYNASYANLKWMAFMVCKIGTTIKPAAANYGLFGNTGGSSTSKGVFINYINSTTNEDTMSLNVVRGTSGQYLGRMLQPGTGPSNQWVVLGMQMDGSQSAGLKVRLYVNDQAIFSLETLNNNTSPVTGPTYALEIGSVGNAALPFIGEIKELVLCSSAPSYETTVGFIRSLMNEYKIIRSNSSYVNVSLVPETFIHDVASTYKLCGVISQNPTNKNQICSAYALGGSHLYNADKKLVIRVSENKAAPFATSFAAETTVYDPADPASIQDCGGGFDQNGLMIIFSDVLNSGSAGGCIGVTMSKSSDLASWTNTDVTASLPADGLAAWRFYGNMIHANGIWVKSFYKLTDHGSTASSAIYIWRSTDAFVTRPVVTVKAPSGTYINESSIAYLGGNSWILIARNESTGEWQQYYSSDNAATWSDQGGITFGETVVSANPLMLKTFMHNGVLVAVAYITNRNDDTAYAIYAKASSIISSGVSGWDLDTKIMWWKTSLAPWHLHYGDVVHLDNTIQAVSIYPYDNFPGAGGTSNKLNYMVMPTWHVPLIESQLGI